mmetsp:Transcript_39065/g.103232  ORF Transcript_39065/g.103232 Transcript_39065/m.103232 type:complete len:464 (+) Transcript_39065:106-1497(+)
MRALRAVLGMGLLALPLAASELPRDADAETFSGWLEALSAHGSDLHPAAMLGLLLPYDRSARHRPLRGQARAPPTVPPQWSANLLSYSANMMGINFTDGVGQFFYDRNNSRMRTTYTVSNDYFRPHAKQLQDTLCANVTGYSKRNMTMGEGKDGACMSFGSMFEYSDMFYWLPKAEYTGSRMAIDGPCDVWSARVNHSAFGHGYTEACFGPEGAARDFTQVLYGKFSLYQNMTFSNVSVGGLSESDWAPSYACGENYPAAPCEGHGVETLELYRIFGPPEPVELVNRNTGDDLGDLSFLCTQASGKFYRSKQVTFWSVKVDTAYGQYALCNYNGTDNLCFGGALDRVGRRSGQMLGVGPVLGQCSPNDDTGSQYSFPESARCPDGVHPGPAAGCAWGFAKAHRTVEAECVLGQRGLLEACASEMGHAPFVKAQRIFRAAFESDDPSKGGCPDAAPPRLQLVVV